MLKVLKDKSLYLYRDASGKQHIRAQIVAGTCSELAGVTEIDDMTFEYGSAALCGKEGELCVLLEDGKWYKQSDGSEVTT